MSSLQIVPLTLAEAQEFVRRHHRHNKPPSGHKFSVGVAKGDEIVGVAVVGLPIARHNHDGLTLEVTRVCTDGTRNANSILYGTCWRAARALGYRRLITYTLQTESGSSLRAAGWKIVGEVRPGGWSRKSRPRVDTHPMQRRFRWEAQADSRGEEDEDDGTEGA